MTIFITGMPKKKKQGYLPKFSGICESDGCKFSICVECGWIVGLNLKQLKSALNKRMNR